MNRLHLLIAFLLYAWCAPAQQLALFTQYRENLTILNPGAVTGEYLAFGQNMSFGASYRAQWTEFSGNPTTQIVRGNFLYDGGEGFNMHGGGYIVNDQTGPTGYTGIYGRVGGVIAGYDPEDGGISIGISAGMVQFRINTQELRLRQTNDALANSSNISQWFPDVGVGVFAYKLLEGGLFDDDYIYGGISVPQVIGLDLALTTDDGDEYRTQRVQHYYAHIGMYNFLDRNRETFLEPSVWVRYVQNAPVSIDFNLRYRMHQFFWLGTGMSTSGNFHAEAGCVIGDPLVGSLQIGFGFDYSFSTFGPSVGGTYEFNVAYGLPY
jgi:type IX secretion system PorP/SprF family membrane protein